MGLVIASLGYEVAFADAAARGILIAEAQHFDLAIIELDLPGVDALQVVAAIARLVPPVPVIALARNIATGEDRNALALQQGALTVLRKPFRREQLMQAIAEATLEVRSSE
jgi:CheY-like chemotaxis protein